MGPVRSWGSRHLGVVLCCIKMSRYCVYDLPRIGQLRIYGKFNKFLMLRYGPLDTFLPWDLTQSSPLAGEVSFGTVTTVAGYEPQLYRASEITMGPKYIAGPS